MFHRNTRKAAPTPNARARLSLTALEDRTTPTPVVTVQTISDAAENGTNGLIRFTRTETAGTLAVNYLVSGTATSGTDFAALSGTINFADGAATADVTVTAATDSIYDPDETVAVTIQPYYPYTVGTPNSATVSIADDVDSVQTLIHQETFILSGSGGTANVTLTVTYNAPGAPGVYTWAYTVQNPTSNSTSWTNFSIPIPEMDGDVQNPTSSNGWTGTVGTDSVSWTAGTALAPGQTATFTFTTAPREVGPADVQISAAGGLLADLPTAPAPRQIIAVPRATFTFSAGTHTYTMKLDMTTADGGAWTTGNFTVEANTPTEARDIVYHQLKSSGFAVQKSGETGIIIEGVKKSDGTIALVKTAKLTIPENVTSVGKIKLTGSTGVTTTSDVPPDFLL